MPEHPNSAPEQRLDLVTGRWIVLAGDRQHRPQEFAKLPEQPWASECDFCAGHEDETTPTVASFPPISSTSPFDWQVRVVENLYPAFVASKPPSIADLTPMRRPSTGRHEVIIESPAHHRRLTELALADVQVIYQAYRNRMQSVRDGGEIRYATIFKNSGRDAGMSREHLHSQFVALPEIPPAVQLELEGAERHFATHHECVFCRLIQDVTDDRSRFVIETDGVIAFCPYASRVPFEIWILPKDHCAGFEDTDDRLLDEVSSIVLETVGRLEACLGLVAYNYLIHSNPFDTHRQDHYHWHIEVLPRISRWAGLEWGTGMLINTMPPERAAERLRGVSRV